MHRGLADSIPLRASSQLTRRDSGGAQIFESEQAAEKTLDDAEDQGEPVDRRGRLARRRSFALRPRREPVAHVRHEPVGDLFDLGSDAPAQALETRDLYSVRWKGRKSITEKVVAAVEGSADAAVRQLARTAQESRFGRG